VHRRQQALEQSKFQTVALPLCAIVDSRGDARATFLGMTRDTREFVQVPGRQREEGRGKWDLHGAPTLTDESAGISVGTRMKYPRPSRRMRAVSLKLPEDVEALLDRIARERNLSRSAVVREALRAYADGGLSRSSVAAAAGDLVGSLNGPRDLSTASKHMAGFGE
jgi:hypothetical protein